MTSTEFRNASGLPDDEQVTTARDLIKLATAIYRDFPQYYPLFATREFVFRGTLVRGHNHLMERYAGMDGLKTGFTNASGFNLVSSAVRGNRRLFAVVMGGQSAFARDQLMATLLDDAFDGRTTDPILVARAAGVDARSARRMLADLSPIGQAEAATLHPRSMRGRRGQASRHAPILAASFSIQVGAYGRHAQAERAARNARHLAALAGKPVQILRPSRGAPHSYRARFFGFSSAEARSACDALRSTGQSCSILPPQRHARVRVASR
jgi:D-alanyl-D-alanine carboxypeptidase/D-alanyl-D-alanine carboxypeptidase (penicillin-binding protein 5/6)